jgi:hypothetical protein
MNIPLLSLFSTDLAIDLGTANTLVFERKNGIVANEPSIVPMLKAAGGVEAAGSEAKEMPGRTPEQITALKPMKNGVIADFKATSHMLNYFIQKAHHRRTASPTNRDWRTWRNHAGGAAGGKGGVLQRERDLYGSATSAGGNWRWTSHSPTGRRSDC